MTDPAAGLAVLHVVDRASATSSQYNEHCLPVMHERRITVCSLFPATVVPTPDITLVQGDGSLPGCYRALRAALAASTYDIVHVHSAPAGLLTLLTYLRERRSRRDLVFTIHNSWPSFRRRNRLLLWLVAALFPMVVACGEASRASLPRPLRWLARRLEVIPNGVDIDRVDGVLHGATRREKRTRRRGLTVLTVNRLIPIKDPDTVMEAFVLAAGSRDRLLIVGGGELASSLSTAVEEAGLESQVQFTGVVPRQDVYAFMQRAAVFVSASKGEGLPVAVLEAMACRCPVVLSDIAPHREIADHAPAVRLVAPADVAGFAQEIRRALRLSRFERFVVGDELRRAVVKQFSVKAMNHGYGRMYRSIVQHNTAPARRRSSVTVASERQRRTRRRVAACITAAVVGALSGFWYGGSHSQGYHATTSLAVKAPDPSASTNQLRANATAASGLADLVRRQLVLEPVAHQLSVGNWRTLPPRVRSRVVENNPPVIAVTASATSARDAERLAAAVADELVAVTAVKDPTGADPGFVDRELSRLQDEMAVTQKQIDGQLSSLQKAGQAVAAPVLMGLRAQLTELQDTYRSMLGWRSTAQAGQGLTIIDQPVARASSLPRSRPALAAVGALAGPAVLVALSLLALATRERPVPRDSKTSEVRPPAGSRLVGSLYALSPGPAARPR